MRVARKFSTLEKRKLHLINWDCICICRTKEDSGLQIKKSKHQKPESICKTSLIFLFKTHSKNSLDTSPKAKYLKSLPHFLRKPSEKLGCSHIWKSLLHE